MDIFTIIILGIVQGATEFLPVSSSGHLVIAGRLLGSDPDFTFDVLVNFGTLLAMIIYFRRKIWQIIKDVTVGRRWDTAISLVLATVPAVLFGFFFQDVIESHLHGTVVVVVMLLVIGIFMIVSRGWQPKKKLPENKDVRDMPRKKAILIGLAQCITLISGSSRSGTTILAGLKLGLDRKAAAEWSFLMGVPIIFGASMKVLLGDEGREYLSSHLGEVFLANIASFISGMVAVTLLMRLLQKYGLYWFGWYRVALAGVLILLLSVNII